MTRLSRARSAISSSSRSPIWRSASVAVSGSKRSLRPSQREEPLGPPLAVLQPEHEQGDDDHDAEAERGRR